MADEIHQFQSIVPPGTLKLLPVTFNLSFPPREVEMVEIRVPPGPRGEVGFALGAAGVQVLPYEPGAFIVTDGETVSWRLERQIDSGAWQLIAYNTGQYNHSLYLTFHTRVPAPGADLLPFQPLPEMALSNPAPARPPGV